MASKEQIERTLQAWPVERARQLVRFTLWGCFVWGGFMAIAFIIWYVIEGAASVNSLLRICAMCPAFGLLWGWSMFAIMEVKYRLRSRRKA